MTAYVFKRRSPPILRYTYDYIIAGSPTITNNVVSSFSNANYLTIGKTFSPGNKSWEIMFQFSPSGANTDNTVIFDVSNDTLLRAITMYLTAGLKMKVGLSSNASSYDIKDEADVNNFTFVANKVYKYKLSFDGSVYKGEVFDVESQTWTTDFTKNSTTPIYSSNLLMIGQWRGKTAPFYGSIDLSPSYIKIDGEYWWRGAKYVKEILKYSIKRKKYWKYKTEVITKYWKEVVTTTTTKELAYAAFGTQGYIFYAPAPVGSSTQLWTKYYYDGTYGVATSVDQLSYMNSNFSGVSETVAYWGGGSYPRNTAADCYKDVTTSTTKVVEGTADDYTYTETETVETLVPGTPEDYDLFFNNTYDLKRK